MENKEPSIEKIRGFFIWLEGDHPLKNGTKQLGRDETRENIIPPARGLAWESGRNVEMLLIVDSKVREDRKTEITDNVGRKNDLAGQSPDWNWNDRQESETANCVSAENGTATCENSNE